MTDEHCPNCGAPETFVQTVTDELTGEPFAQAFACRRCGWRKEGPPATPQDRVPLHWRFDHSS